MKSILTSGSVVPVMTSLLRPFLITRDLKKKRTVATDQLPLAADSTETTAPVIFRLYLSIVSAEPDTLENAQAPIFVLAPARARFYT